MPGMRLERLPGDMDVPIGGTDPYEGRGDKLACGFGF